MTDDTSATNHAEAAPTTTKKRPSVGYKNPANGHVEYIGAGALLLGMLFGPLYYMFQGAWAAFLASILVGWALPIAGFMAGSAVSVPMAIAGGFIGSLAWSFLMTKLMARAYLRKGWVRVEA